MKRFALCGVSGRGVLAYVKPMVESFSKHCKLVALLDPDPKRFDFCKETVEGIDDVPVFGTGEFDMLIEETKPDLILAMGRDNTHKEWIIKALEKDLDVISEKPMVTTAADAKAVMDAEKKSKGRVQVGFNVRYNPAFIQIKEMVAAGKIGRVTQADFNYYLDTRHGASYFKRWHRMRENSGGLTIHKSTHHLDVANWVIGQKPEQVFAYGALNYYGADSESNPKKVDGRFCATCPDIEACAYIQPYVTRTEKIERLAGQTEENPFAEKYTDYRMDACIFDSEINIEDTYTTSTRYDQGAILSYTLNFSLPYEGFRFAVNGTGGRIETEGIHGSYNTPDPHIRYMPLFGPCQDIRIVKKEGGHGGADPILLEELLLGEDPKKGYRSLADAEDGALAVAQGEAVWRSIKENRPILLSDLLS